jgi:hypothetical protein
MKLQQEVTQDILNENKDFLMDAWIEKCSLKRFYKSKKHQRKYSLHHFTIRECQENPLSVSSSCTSKLHQYRQAIVGDIITKYKYIFN